MAVPWIAPRTDDGRHLFGALHPGRQRHALLNHRCQVCGRRLGERLVLLMRLRDLPRQCTSELALHPVCAAYTEAAYPMVVGRLARYRSTPLRLDADMAAGPDEPVRLGTPAEPWLAVWLRTYRPIIDPLNDQPAASYAGIRPLRVRSITWRHLLP